MALASLICVGDSGLLPANEPGDMSHAFVSMLLDGPKQAQPFQIDASSLRVPPGGHLQGIQCLTDEAKADRTTIVLSHDSLSEAYLVTADCPSDLSGLGRVASVQLLPSDGQLPPLRHAGGFQLTGNVLAVGVEDNQQKLRSQIQFWNFALREQPQQLQHLTIVRRSSMPKDMTAGAVGLVRLDRSYLLAVANWDSRAIDFYVSNGKELIDRACRFEFRDRWEDASADKSGWRDGPRFGAYQSINLVADASGRIAIFGFETSPQGEDRVDVFAIDRQQPLSRRLRKVASKTVKLVEGSHFRNAAGLVAAPGKLTLLASPNQLGPTTTLSILPCLATSADDRLPTK